MAEQSFGDKARLPMSKQEIIDVIKEHKPVRPLPGQIVKSIDIGGILAAGRVPIRPEIPQIGEEDKKVRDE